jgi:hypothetical protein
VLAVSQQMARYHWTHDLARIVLQDIIRRNRENGRRRRLKEDAARGIKARPGRPPKDRISKLLFDPERGPVPIAPSPTPPPATPSADDPSIDITSSQAPIAGLVQGSMLARRMVRPSIAATNSVRTPTIAVPPTSTTQGKPTAAHVSKQTTTTTTQSQLGRPKQLPQNSHNASSQGAVASLTSQEASPSHSPDNPHYRVRIVGAILTLPIHYSMAEWINAIDTHIHHHQPEADVPNDGSGYKYYVPTDGGSREVIISRDLELLDDYSEFLERIRRDQVVVNPDDQSISLSKVWLSPNGLLFRHYFLIVYCFFLTYTVQG